MKQRISFSFDSDFQYYSEIDIQDNDTEKEIRRKIDEEVTTAFLSGHVVYHAKMEDSNDPEFSDEE